MTEEKSVEIDTGFSWSNSTVDPAFWEDIGIPNSFGWNISRRTSANVGLMIAVLCARVKARDISKSGMRLLRRVNKRWEQVEAGEHWFARMLMRRPNEVQSWGDFWRMLLLNYELTQNAYVLKRMTRSGEIKELIPVRSALVRLRTSTTGRRFYEIHAGNENDRGNFGNDTIIMPPDRMVHIYGSSMDGVAGFSNAVLGDPMFQLAGAITSFQQNLFGNDGKQPMVFETDAVFGTGEMADATFNRLKAQLRESVRRMNMYGDPILLEAGLKAKAIAVNSRDALTTEAYNTLVTEICALMETPPHKIFHYDKVKYDNQAAADRQYASDCLFPTADNFEEKLRNGLLEEEEWDTLWPEFDREQMVVNDSEAINNRIKAAVSTGVMMINEARERLGLNPVAGGDVFLVPVNMAIMDEDGKVQQLAADGQTAGSNNEGSRPGDDQTGGVKLAVVKN